MFNNIDLRELAQISGPERAFVSLYLANPESLNGLKGRAEADFVDPIPGLSEAGEVAALLRY